MSGQAALKGFRTQTLYIIHRALSSDSDHITFQPEGQEDLDIFDQDERMIETIQVKNLSDPLTFSDLWDNKGRTSFFKRSAESFLGGKRPRLTVASFGKIGQELENFGKVKNAHTDKKFGNTGISKEAIQYINENTKIIPVQVDVLEKEAREFIIQYCVALDSDIAMTFLQSMVQNYSEDSKGFTKKDIIEFLNKIGTFIVEREKYFRHFHTTIKSFSASIPKGDILQSLKSEYRLGSSAKYEHILADLDVIRLEKLEEIDSKYRKSNTVIVHGASGQGKTSLALRYIHSFNPLLCYRVAIPDTFTEVMEQIKALEAIARNLGLPILIYVDVEPSNIHWTRLLSEFRDEQNIRFLVTIRSEDWNRASGKGEDFNFAAMELIFDETEARAIYERLEISQVDSRHINFEEVWSLFGSKGPLLEFTYLVTQGESLQTKLRSQIENIIRIEPNADEILKLLCIVSLADGNGTNVPIENIKSANISQLSWAIQLFEKEHLLKVINEGKYLAGLHPVRSLILVEILIDNFVRTLPEIFKLTVSLIDEVDAYLFLVNCFYRYSEIEDNAVSLLSPSVFKTLTGYRNCLLALIWLGIFKFSKKYVPDFQELRKKDPSMILILYHLDVTGTLNSEDSLSEVPLLQKFVQQSTAQAKLSGMDNSEYFIFAREWISKTPISFVPELTTDEGRHLGETLFWHNFLNQLQIDIPSSDKLLSVAEQSKIGDLAVLLFGLEVLPLHLRNLIEPIQEIFLAKLIEKYNIPLIERIEGEIKAHFLINIFSQDSTDSESARIAPNRSREIVRLLRLAFPAYLKFSTQGYGHGLETQMMTFDDSIVDILKENLPNPFFKTINSIARNLILWHFRPSSWREFVSSELEIRRMYLTSSEVLRSRLVKFFREKRTRKALKSLSSETNAIVVDGQNDTNFYPKTVSDGLGMVSELQDKKSYGFTINPFDNINDGSLASTLTPIAIQIYDQTNSSRRSYYFGMNNFYQQCKEVIRFANNNFKIGPDNIPHVSKSNIQAAFLHLVSYQIDFANLFGKYLSMADAEKLVRKEFETTLDLLTMWQSFTDPNSQELLPIVLSGKKRLENHKLEFERNVLKNLAEKSETLAATFKVHFRPNFKAVFITVDSPSPIQLLSAVEKAYTALFQAYGSRHPFELGSTMLKLNYNDFYIIPLLSGMALNKSGYKFQLHNFQGEGAESLKPFNWIQLPIEEDYFSDLEIKFWEKEFEAPQNFHNAFFMLSANVDRIAELESLLSKIEEGSQGFDLLLTFTLEAKNQCEEAFQKLLKPMNEQLSKMKIFIAKGEVPASEDELFGLITELWKQILPPRNDEMENDQITLHMNDWVQWAKKLGEAKYQASMAYYVWLEVLAREIALDYSKKP